MRRVWMWFYLSCKRYMHRPSFLVILLLLPLGTFFIRSSEKQEPAELRIAVCAEREEEGDLSLWQTGKDIRDREENGRREELPGKQRNTSFEQQVVEALTGEKEPAGLFRFYECENEQQVKDEVASRRAECGYVIGAGLKKRLDERDFKRSIRVYSAPSTVAAKLSAEPVFAAMIELYDRELFLQYVEEKQAESTDKNAAGELYDKWKENGSTFHFVYELADSPNAVKKENVEASVFPVRGIVAIYVFIVGLYGAAISLGDEKKGLFLAVPFGVRTWCRMAALASPVCLAAVSGLAALWTGKCMGKGSYELAVLLGYVLAVVLFSFVVRLVCRREDLVCCLIPFFLVGSLVFCPVFLDIGKYVPEFGSVGRLFLPGYYMGMFR